MLTVAADQNSLVQTTSGYAETALSDGVGVGVGLTVDPVEKYAVLPAAYHPKVREVFLLVLAAFVKAMNLPRALPTGISGTATLAKLTGGGANGSLTFVDGLITGYSAPT